MDKYAVDLDQLLNDFEYSELRDSYPAVQSRGPDVSSYSQNNVVKHSINNVFHSLNEYLNTDITPKVAAGQSVVTSDSDQPVQRETIKQGPVDDHQPIEDNTTVKPVETPVKPLISEIFVAGDCVIKDHPQVNGDHVILQAQLNDDCVIKRPQDSVILQHDDQVGLEVEDQETSQQDQVILEQEPVILQEDQTIVQQDQTIVRQDHALLEQDQTLLQQDHVIKEQDYVIKQQDQTLLQQDIVIKQQDQTLLQQDHVIKQQDHVIKQQDHVIKQQDYVEKQQDHVIKQQDHVIKQQDHDITQQDHTLLQQNHVILEQDHLIPQQDHVILQQDPVIFQQDHVKLQQDTHEFVAKSIESENLEKDQVLLEDPVKKNSVGCDSANLVNDANSATLQDSVILHNIKVDEDRVSLESAISNAVSLESAISNAVNLEKDSVILEKDSVILEKDSVILGKDSVKLDKDCEILHNPTLKSQKTDGAALCGVIDEAGLVEDFTGLDVKEFLSIKSENKTENLVVVQEKKVISFDNCIEDDDDKDLLNELENLEDELKEDQQEDNNFEDAQEYIEEKPVEEKTPAKNNLEEPTIEEKPSQEETLEENHHRPDNLPINGPVEMDAKQINLVGGPGSTPYNNVYKDLTKEKVSDSEYSTSESPSFSDISSDTASTCSADNVPPIEQNKYKKDPRNKANLYKIKHGVLPVGLKAPAEAPPGEEQVEQTQPSTAPPVDNLEPPAEAATTTTTAGEPPQEQCTLGKKPPYWMPDEEAEKCLHCDAKFTVIKRRHHCRACGKVLCSKCCNMKYKLSYLDTEARVCAKCHEILVKLEDSSSNSSEASMYAPSPVQRPNPNNPAEYCSTVSPLEQVGGASAAPPAVMVPVGVLKRKGSNKAKHNKTVMFCDGIRPGSDLTNLDNDFNYNNTKTGARKPEKVAKVKTNIPQLDPVSKSFIPGGDVELPPTVTIYKTDISYSDCANGQSLVETLRAEQLTFALNLNLYVHLKIVNMDCCVNKTVWCFSTEGLINVGQDEIVILLEVMENETQVPKQMFDHINSVYMEAAKGTSVKELGLSLHNASSFLDSKNHAGFVFIKPSFQCMQNITTPKEPYLVGILIHKWETPWAKLFPLRLVLRLGALYRYYPSPIISTRHRDSVFVEIGHTIINLLADFRNYSYTLPQIRGLTIHMEDKNTTITIPSNRYDQVMKSVSNSTDHILAFAGNFSQEADSHLVCIQDTQDNENSYTTHAINIHNKPRKITGASFIVFNGALKSSSGLTAKSNIVEDGLMIQVLPEHMVEIRESLRAMKNHTIQCGVVNSTTDENVHIVWGENDVNFNAGILSPIDNTPMNGIPSIRVHNAKDFICNSGNRLIRWTEVFIIQNNDDSPKNRDPVDISKISESIAKATCSALVKYLDLLVTNNFYKIGIRTNLHVENVSYSAGSNNTKLPPIYMKSLDNELIPVLHRITSNNLGEHAIVIELIFRILNT